MKKQNARDEEIDRLNFLARGTLACAEALVQWDPTDIDALEGAIGAALMLLERAADVQQGKARA